MSCTLLGFTYIRNMTSVQASLLEISCLHGFHNFTPVDPKWPLTFIKSNRLLVLNVVHLHTNYEICPSFPSWDIMFTRFSQFCCYEVISCNPATAVYGVMKTLRCLLEDLEYWSSVLTFEYSLQYCSLNIQIVILPLNIHSASQGSQGSGVGSNVKSQGGSNIKNYYLKI